MTNAIFETSFRDFERKDNVKPKKWIFTSNNLDAGSFEDVFPLKFIYKRTLIYLSEKTQLYRWSNNMSKMFIAHYTDTDTLNMTCYDIIEQ